MVEVNGLILAGGFSTRMDMDKSHLDFHGKPQYVFLEEMMTPLVGEVFISCRQDQHFDHPVSRIEDTREGIGPLAGLLSAFEFNAHVAWLMVACDMPYVDGDVLQRLLSARDVHKHATYFVDLVRHLPEPMLTIFEPSIYPLLQSALQDGQLSLNKILQMCDGQEILLQDEKILKSVNTQEELRDFKLRG